MHGGRCSSVVSVLLLCCTVVNGHVDRSNRGSGRVTHWRPSTLFSRPWSSSKPPPIRDPPKLPMVPWRPISTTPEPMYEKPPVPEDSKIELGVGTCLLHLYEPCYSSKLLLYFFPPNMATQPVLVNASEPESLSQSGINPNLPTKLIIHGYSGSLYYEPTYQIAKAYLATDNVNVLMLDWSAYTNMPCYLSAVINTWQSGKCAAQAIYNMAAWSQIPGRFLNKMHLIGFSLGAHVAGFAASYLRPARIGRITGLDPALPLFATLSRSWKLDANDARFVDVIHTNVGMFGKIDHTGHVDFYPNGGTIQPACNNSRRPLCNHLMAPAYFAESIAADSPGFWGTPCYSFLYYVMGWCDTPEEKTRTVVNMGERCPRSARGVYFVTTNANVPYGMGPLADAELLEEDPQALIAEPITIEDIENNYLFQNSTSAF